MALIQPLVNLPAGVTQDVVALLQPPVQAAIQAHNDDNQQQGVVWGVVAEEWNNGTGTNNLMNYHYTMWLGRSDGVGGLMRYGLGVVVEPQVLG